MIFKDNKVYNILKWIGITVLPALMALYGVIGSALNISNTDIVLTIWGAVITCYDTIIGISSVQYHK